MSKTKIAIVMMAALLFGGVAAAQGIGGSDGKLDRRAKHAEMRQQRLAQFDTNKDGKLDDSERTAMREARIVAMFSKLDADGNGVITLTELKEGTLKLRKRHGHFGKRGHRGPQDE